MLWTVGGGKSQRWLLEKTTVNASAPVVTAKISYPMNNFRTSQGFAVYNSSKASSSGRPYHCGIDIVSSTDTNIYAAADGTVLYTGYTNGNGNHVVISHNINGQSFRTLYSHLSSINCQKGSSVSRGSKIGVMGNTGASNGAHLHFGIYQNGGTDPLGYTKTKNSATVLSQDGVYFYDPVYVVQNGKLP